MHPRENTSTERLVRVQVLVSRGEASIKELLSDLTNGVSDDHRIAITSGACQPTLPGPAPVKRELSPPAGPGCIEALPNVLNPKLLCPVSFLEVTNEEEV
jgi:hypothetical protein